MYWGLGAEPPRIFCPNQGKLRVGVTPGFHHGWSLVLLENTVIGYVVSHFVHLTEVMEIFILFLNWVNVFSKVVDQNFGMSKKEDNNMDCKHRPMDCTIAHTRTSSICSTTKRPLP